MRRWLSLVLLLAPLVFSFSGTATAQCSGQVGGTIGSNGMYSVGGHAECGSSGGGVGPAAGYHVTRSVRPAPTICTDTPDALQETLRYYAPGNPVPVRTVTRCVSARIPSDPLPPPPPSAVSVFREAPLVAPEIHLSPPTAGLVGVETWLWWGGDPRVAPLGVSAGGWSASISVDAPTLRWDLGNGDVRTTRTAGTGPDDPSLRYVYERPCDCTVTLTARWTGTVTLTHPLADAPIVQRVGPVDLSTTVAYPVEAREAVIVG